MWARKDGMTPLNIDDLRQEAKRALPKALFDFVDGGALDERTLHDNRAHFANYRLLPKVMIDVAQRSQAVEVLGQRFDTPLILAPTGMTALFGAGGEIAAAKAANAMGAGFCLSTMASTTIEDVAKVRPDFWFQLYIQKDRGLTRSLVERAAAAGCRTLFVTVDLAVQGQRERDTRNGFTVPPKLTVKNAIDFLSHPRWLWRMATQGPFTFANFKGINERDFNFTTLAHYIGQQFDPSLTWKDIDWLKSIWPGKVGVKGLVRAEDARIAADHGADAVVVSNHGGRQLDNTVSTISALPAVADAVGDRLDVLIDGGIRRGSDVLTALALGAKACLIGRPFVYGLAADGEAGATKALSILKGEIDAAQALIGCPKAAEIDRSFLAETERPWPANR